MKDSDDVIDRILVDGYSRELLFPCDTHDFVIFRVDRERDDLLSVRHDLRDFFVVELENILDHFLLGIFDVAGFGADIYHHADLFFGNCLIGLVGIDPEQTQNEICRYREDPYEGL